MIWDRVRYDLVALLALLASVACGIVPATEAFRGFSNDIVIIVGSALVVSAAIGRSGLIKTLMKPFVPRMTTSDMQVAVLASAVTALSAFVKNIGALAIFIPIALQIARRTQKPPSRVLMPLAFGSLFGGLITLIGTSPNIIVSQDARADQRRAVSHVRLRTGGRVPGHRGRRLPHRRLAAAAEDQKGAA